VADPQPRRRPGWPLSRSQPVWARQLAGRPRRVDILLTHLHVDHIQGLMFFAPLFMPDTEIVIWGHRPPRRWPTASAATSPRRSHRSICATSPAGSRSAPARRESGRLGRRTTSSTRSGSSASPTSARSQPVREPTRRELGALSEAQPPAGPEFAEPVALSSAPPADRPLPRRALRRSLNLVALRARRRPLVRTVPRAE
jgi:hypothetical protein